MLETERPPHGAAFLLLGLKHRPHQRTRVFAEDASSSGGEGFHEPEFLETAPDGYCGWAGACCPPP